MGVSAVNPPRGTLGTAGGPTGQWCWHPSLVLAHLGGAGLGTRHPAVQGLGVAGRGGQGRAWRRGLGRGQASFGAQGRGRRRRLESWGEAGARFGAARGDPGVERRVRESQGAPGCSTSSSGVGPWTPLQADRGTEKGSPGFKQPPGSAPGPETPEKGEQ